MIDIVTEQEFNLKNITQIGTPGEGEKIYIEDSAYARIHMDVLKEMQVFVLMGHTSCQEGKYTTFVEAAFPVEEIMFENTTPIWNNRVWSEVFHEIKCSYEKSIIVGWALDIKGVTPQITSELEAIHREHFGGLHQLFFLLDTVGQEEYFYLNKNNHLYQKDGFYIYYDAGKKRVAENLNRMPKQVTNHVRPRQERHISITPEYFSETSNKMKKKQETEQEMSKRKEPENYGRPSARQVLMEQQTHTVSGNGEHSGALGVAAAVILLVGIIGAAYLKNPQEFKEIQKIITTFGEHKSDDSMQTGNDIIYLGTEEMRQETQETGSTQQGQPTEAPQDSSTQLQDAAGQSQDAGDQSQNAGGQSQQTALSGEEAAGRNTEQAATETAAMIPVEKIDGGIPDNMVQ